MSLFLPEGSNTPSLQAPGVAQPTSPEVTDADIKLMQRVLGAAAQTPNLIPDTFMAYLFDFIQTQRLQIPIGQVFGFSQFTANSAAVAAHESTTSTSYTDLVTVGPVLDGLGDGQYLIILNSWLVANTSPAGAAFMSVDINGAGAVDANAIVMPYSGSVFFSGARVLTATLASGTGNTITAKYRCAGVSGADFQNRSLVALKYANA